MERAVRSDLAKEYSLGAIVWHITRLCARVDPILESVVCCMSDVFSRQAPSCKDGQYIGVHLEAPYLKCKLAASWPGRAV
jgi:hypothetical protein